MQPQALPNATSQHRSLDFTPFPLRTARILLMAALLGAPLALGAVDPWASTALGLVASLALFLWALGSVQ